MDRDQFKMITYGLRYGMSTQRLLEKLNEVSEEMDKKRIEDMGTHYWMSTPRGCRSTSDITNEYRVLELQTENRHLRTERRKANDKIKFYEERYLDMYKELDYMRKTEKSVCEKADKYDRIRSALK